ncbi:MAG TPA: hypothetical protein VM120_19340 [Bryobacteraceae bacterium]|nr:hypothetical protein [Bryobacteraceae bacterium]
MTSPIITAPGEYRTRDGRKVIIHWCDEEYAFGYLKIGDDTFLAQANFWRSDTGRPNSGAGQLDITGPWVEPRKRQSGYLRNGFYYDESEKDDIIGGNLIPVREYDPQAEKEAKGILEHVIFRYVPEHTPGHSYIKRALSLLFPDEAV